MVAIAIEVDIDSMNLNRTKENQFKALATKGIISLNDPEATPQYKALYWFRKSDPSMLL